MCFICVLMNIYLIHAQLVKSDADVFCLQDVWLPEHQQQIYKAVKGIYSYIASAIDLERDITFNKTPACDSAIFQELLSCTEANCKTVFEAEILPCYLIQCYDILSLLSTECTVCFLIAGRGRECLNDPISLYQRTLGLMLLSKFELSDVNIQPYTPEAINQSAVYGYIEANVSFLFKC